MITVLPDQSHDLGKTTLAAHLVTADAREGKQANGRCHYANIAPKTARRDCREFHNDSEADG
jgi:hypothetical protein